MLCEAAGLRIARRSRSVLVRDAAGDPPPDLDALRILRAFVGRGTDFVVIGGIATVLHGSSRNTFALDISFAVDPQNLEASARCCSR